MSLKSIDLQMAIHRNDEAGLRQHQVQHKPEVDQSQLGNQALKHADRERERAGRLEESPEAHIQAGDHDAGQGGSHRDSKPRQRKENVPGEMKAPLHPFKGHRLDVSM
ncbi:hypothetical protein ACFFK0_18190 [Paenibacillus chartarius]|uniref:Uncharacterized protein n=1 Tax=Paenibacillus chartarius TaxID=747481 RepID=A0ABV6DNZ3_9BACL